MPARVKSVRPTSSGALATVFTVSATLSKILQATESKEWMGLCHFRSTGVAVVSTNLKKYLKVSSLVDRVICTSFGLAFYRNRRIQSRVWLNRWRCRTFARPYVFSAYEMADETTGKLVTRETISTWNTSFSFTLDVIPLLCAWPLVLEHSNKVALNWNEFHQLGYLPAELSLVHSTTSAIFSRRRDTGSKASITRNCKVALSNYETATCTHETAMFQKNGNPIETVSEAALQADTSSPVSSACNGDEDGSDQTLVSKRNRKSGIFEVVYLWNIQLFCSRQEQSAQFTSFLEQKWRKRSQQLFKGGSAVSRTLSHCDNVRKRR